MTCQAVQQCIEMAALLTDILVTRPLLRERLERQTTHLSAVDPSRQLPKILNGTPLAYSRLALSS